jgi:hypothetical protein
VPALTALVDWAIPLGIIIILAAPAAADLISVLLVNAFCILVCLMDLWGGVDQTDHRQRL